MASTCEDCGDPVERRRTCWHCGRKVCGYCWQHKHRCEPGHTVKECRDLRQYMLYGKQWIARLRARAGLT